MNDGSLKAMGYNFDGQLGDGGDRWENVYTPKNIMTSQINFDSDKHSTVMSLYVADLLALNLKSIEPVQPSIDLPETIQSHSLDSLQHSLLPGGESVRGR